MTLRPTTRRLAPLLITCLSIWGCSSSKTTDGVDTTLPDAGDSCGARRTGIYKLTTDQPAPACLVSGGEPSRVLTELHLLSDQVYFGDWMCHGGTYATCAIHENCDAVVQVGQTGYSGRAALDASFSDATHFTGFVHVAIPQLGCDETVPVHGKFLGAP
jgi:hypothetical protein